MNLNNIFSIESKRYYMKLKQSKFDTCLIQMSVNLREKGNSFFIKREFKEAMECYQQYVKEEHNDNAKAYFNLSLCYDRLGDYQKQIEACTCALEREKTYTKVYYRLMKTYKQMKNKDYDAFINAIQFLKHDEKVEEKQRAEIWKFIDNYKEKIRIKIYGSDVKIKKDDQSFQRLERLRVEMSGDQNINQLIDKYLSEWINEWNSDVQSEDAKWEEILYIIQNQDYNHGINLAYFYLNSITNKQKRKVIIQKIKEIKKQMGKVQPIPVYESNSNDQIILQNQYNQDEIEKMSSSSEENLFESESASQKKKNKSNTNSEKKKQAPSVFPLPLEKTAKNSPSQKEVKPPTVFNSKKQLLAKKRLQKEQIAKLSQILNEQQIEILLDQYCERLKNPKMIFAQTFRVIESMLNSNQTQLTKQQLLIQFKKRTKKLSLIIGSLTKNEKKIIYDLLVRNNIEEFAIDYSPDYYKP